MENPCHKVKCFENIQRYILIVGSCARPLYKGASFYLTKTPKICGDRHLMINKIRGNRHFTANKSDLGNKLDEYVEFVEETYYKPYKL